VGLILEKRHCKNQIAFVYSAVFHFPVEVIQRVVVRGTVLLLTLDSKRGYSLV
jgi:hypothetical protein